MKVLVDTNIFQDYIDKREQHDAARKIFLAAEKGKVELYVSFGSLYTLCYLTERSLKNKGIHKPEQTQLMRLVLQGVLSVALPLSLNYDYASIAIEDEHYTDLEDSLQYQCAIQNRCEAILTINVKDFKGANPSLINVVSPPELLAILDGEK